MKRVAAVFIGCVGVALLVCPTPALAQGGGGGGGGHVEVFGNNLSFPVIWAEGVTKTLRGTPGMTPLTQDAWMFWWGTTAEGDPMACMPTADATGCADGQVLGAGAIRAYLQKEELNVWQAGSVSGVAGTSVAVNWIDWGDNLESQDWYDRSQVRTEVVLFQDLATPMLEYGMRHLSGWGIDEIHGLAAGAAGNAPEIGPGTQATVYSDCARLTIQKLLVAREDLKEGDLAWDIATDQWVGAPINSPIFNKAVWEAGDGPGYYAAEINVKGRVIYGYTWNVRTLNDSTGGGAAGDYRITFSLDASCPAGLNTSLATAQILTATEEEAVIEEEPVAGAVPVLDVVNNLTYADVRILPRTGGKVKIK